MKIALKEVDSDSAGAVRGRICGWKLQRLGINRLRARVVEKNSLSISLPSPTNLP